MRALMYADLCAIRKTFGGNVLVSILIVAPAIVSSMSGEGGTEIAIGVTLSSMIVAMLSFFMVIHLFSSDEMNEWQTVRLTMPFMPREVVRSRYAFVACGVAALVCLATLAGSLIQFVVSLTEGGSFVTRGVLEVFGGACLAGLAVLLSLSISMPFVFRFGSTRARIAFSAPYLLLMLLAFDPVRDFVLGILDILVELTVRMGTPVPLIVAAVACVVVFYLVSMQVSERLYSMRDF